MVRYDLYPRTALLVSVAAAASVTFGDINLLVVTDAHSWIAGHVHDDHVPKLNADYGDIASAVGHVKARAAAEGRDVFFVNNGDHVEGSGLSDASVYLPPYIHGYNLFPLIQMMPFDALTVGNHDLYDNSTVAFMQTSGFVASWGGNYLTSNTLNATTGDTIGAPYTILKGPNSGTKVLVFGFLYHMEDSCTSVVVEDPAVTVEAAWFAAALDAALAEGVNAIVVLSHMDLKDPTVNVLQAAVRGHDARLAEMPLLFVTGHTHYTGFAKVDNFSASFEAGHYLDTLGWISFDLPSPATAAPSEVALRFDFEFVAANLNALYDFTGTSASTFDTDTGLRISQAINATVQELGLREVLGCPAQNYSYSAELGAPNSLYDLYMKSVIPGAVLDVPTGSGHEAYYLTSTGSLRYDIYAPRFYYDDVFAVAPFTNVFLYYPTLQGSEVTAVSALLNNLQVNAAANPLKWQQSSSMPQYIGGPFDVGPSATYDLFLNDYDEPSVVGAIASVRGVSADAVRAALVPWRSERESGDFVDTTICWAKHVAELWPCD